MGLNGSLPGLVAVDLHVAGGLPALLPPPPPGPPGSRSTANGVSESSRHVVGHAGFDLVQDGKAWLWDLRLGPEFSGTSSSVACPCVVTLASDFNGDFSGASPCDLHVILPCGGSGEGIGEGSGQAQAASSGGESVSGDEGGPSSTPMSVADAMSALGFSTPEQFYAWIVEASEEQADAATYVLWTLVESNS